MRCVEKGKNHGGKHVAPLRSAVAEDAVEQQVIRHAVVGAEERTLNRPFVLSLSKGFTNGHGGAVRPFAALRANGLILGRARFLHPHKRCERGEADF